MINSIRFPLARLPAARTAALRPASIGPRLMWSRLPGSIKVGTVLTAELLLLIAGTIVSRVLGLFAFYIFTSSVMVLGGVVMLLGALNAREGLGLTGNTPAPQTQAEAQAAYARHFESFLRMTFICLVGLVAIGYGMMMQNWLM